MIRSVNGNSELSKLVPSDARSPQQQTNASPSPAQPSDSIELSERARELLRNPELAQRQRIEANLDSGFYNSPQVLQTVAQRLLRDLDSSSPMGT
ncbi:MAG: hypothetical protein N2663_06205 [Chlorobi bacterium]|nr:hypothetical protein [Chlorobiota bacterium]